MPENREKNPRCKDENQQQTQPTCDGNRTRATALGGERSHHRGNLADKTKCHKIGKMCSLYQRRSFSYILLLINGISFVIPVGKELRYHKTMVIKNTIQCPHETKVERETLQFNTVC